MKKLFFAAALVAAAALTGPVNAGDVTKDISKSTGIDLPAHSNSGAVLNNCAGDKMSAACQDQDGKAADGLGEQHLGISPPEESKVCNDRAADITDPNCNRPDMPKQPSGK